MKPLLGISTLGDQYTGTREKIITNIQNGKLCANKRIAGIPCPDIVSTEAMLEFFTKENLEISKIKDELKEAGLPFKAIVPTAFYKEIKRKKEVYTFKKINDEGFTEVSEYSMKQFIEKEHKAFNKPAKMMAVIPAIILSTIGLLVSEYYTWQWQLIHNSTTGERIYNFCWFNVPILIVIGVLMYGLIEGFKLLLQRFVFNTSRFWKRITSKLSTKGHNTFWPAYEDCFYGPKVKLDFIKPDSESIADNILEWKKAGYDVNISAQKEAFTLDIAPLQDSLQSMVNEIEKKEKMEVQKKIEARRLFWQMLFLSDPIISTEVDEKYTVLINAYGGKSFVSEREVIENVEEYYGKKLNQFQTFLN